MLQLAQLKNARGDRSGATEHLERYMLLYPTDDSRPSRPRVALWLVRLLFEQNQTSRGCEALRMGRDAMAQESLEMRNQLEFYAPRCAFVEAPKPVDLAPDTAATPPARPMPAARTPQRAPARAAEPPSRPAVDSVTTAAPPRTTAAPRAAAAAPTAKSFFSVQVAAYDSPEAAKRMAEGLVARGLDARVDGTVRPFRVRIGRFATRADAAKLALALKAQGQNGFVTLVNPD
ncbi:MAG: SPOR domain-containing protein [Gemmatimonadaceae bacterium]